jgi:ATP-dependent DNA helicase RecG
MDSPRRAATTELALDTPIDRLKGLGPKRAAAWNAEGVERVEQLLRWPPRRHVAFAAATPIAALVDGQAACIRATVRRRKGSGRRGVVATRLEVEDESGGIAAILFGPRWLATAFARDEVVLLRGEARSRERGREFLVRAWLHGEELPAANAPALQPQYALPEGIAPRFHRRLLRALLERLAPPLAREVPPWATAATGRARSLHEWLVALHFPVDDAERLAARRAFALEAAIAIQRRLQALRAARAPRRTAPHAAAGFLPQFMEALPFAPTGDQRRALEEIAGDLGAARPMARLLSGDVGSGKSAVAWFPLIAAARAGRQGALLAPTEILARQHERMLASLLPRLGLPPPRLLASGAERPAALDAPIVVGTHRLLSAPVRFRDLAAVVVDEQHKFGVRQRWRLFEKGGQPDLLLVSATPIPRTLAHALLGHLDLSLLAQRPFAARQVRTELLLGEARRGLAERMKQEMARGGKAFVVCPAIAGGETSARGLASAESVAPWLVQQLGREVEVALLHGRLDPQQKQARLDAFASGSVRVLVATVVVEVGIDVPDATLAVILGAERFGLSQMHQIRGRIGRRGLPAVCLVVSAEPGEEARSRLDAFASTDDGFALAELDFAQRGPGELLGTRQHGALQALFPEALLDPALVELARSLAESEGPRKSVDGKPFRGRTVAGSAAIW